MGDQPILGRATGLLALVLGTAGAVGLAGPASAAGGGNAAALAAVQAAAVRTHTLGAGVTLTLTPPRVTAAAPKPILGTGAFDFSSGAGQATLHEPGSTETVVFQPASIFVRQLPRQANALPPGKSWISAGLTEFPVLSVNFPLFVLQTEGANPSFLLNEVVWGATSAAPLGGQAVNGRPATLYQVRVSPALAASHASGPAAQGFSNAVAFELQALGESGQGAGSSAASQSVKVWIENGTVVQLAASPGAGQGTTTMTLTATGVRVHPVTPPRSEIVDLATLVPGGERENNGGGDSDGA